MNKKLILSLTATILALGITSAQALPTITVGTVPAGYTSFSFATNYYYGIQTATTIMAIEGPGPGNASSVPVSYLSQITSAYNTDFSTVGGTKDIVWISKTAKNTGAGNVTIVLNGPSVPSRTCTIPLNMSNLNTHPIFNIPGNCDK